MRQEQMLTWSAASLFLVMLLAITTVGTRSYRSTAHIHFGTTTNARWGMAVADRTVHPPLGARPTPTPHDTTNHPSPARSDALILLMLLGQGAHPTIGLR
jgi:hypothetical protein